VLERLARHGAPALAAGIFLGLALPELAAALRPLLVPAIAVSFVVALARVDPGRLRALARTPRTTLPLLSWLLLGAPALVMFVTERPEVPPALGDALLLHAAAPPVMASSALALLLGLEVELAVLATTAATLLAPLTLALVVHAAGIEVAVAAPELALRLALLLAVCGLLGAWLRRRLGPLGLLAHARRLDGAAVAGLLVFAVAVMDGVRGRLAADPGAFLGLLAAAFALNLGLQLAGALLFAHHGRRTALTVGLLSGNTNLGLVMAGLADVAPPTLALYVALAQFPVYLLPALLLPLCRRLLDDGDG